MGVRVMPPARPHSEPQFLNGNNADMRKARAEAPGHTSIWVCSLQASNIDDVLGHHTSFLDNCLKDCMLTNPELLKVFSKLMSVCVMFTNCMQVRAKALPTLLPLCLSVRQAAGAPECPSEPTWPVGRILAAGFLSWPVSEYLAILLSELT